MNVKQKCEAILCLRYKHYIIVGKVEVMVYVVGRRRGQKFA